MFVSNLTDVFCIQPFHKAGPSSAGKVLCGCFVVMCFSRFDGLFLAGARAPSPAALHLLRGIPPGCSLGSCRRLVTNSPGDDGVLGQTVPECLVLYLRRRADRWLTGQGLALGL